MEVEMRFMREGSGEIYHKNFSETETTKAKGAIMLIKASSIVLSHSQHPCQNFQRHGRRGQRPTTQLTAN